MPPLSHPQAQFVPISPELDLATLVESASNFDYVTRLPRGMLQEHSAQSLEQLILLHVVIGGKPLVIEGWEDHMDPNIFSPHWLQQTMDKTEQRVRDIPSSQDIPMTMGHYLRSMHQLTNQFTNTNYRNAKRQRLYLKDIDVPEEWAIALEALLPETFYYLNDCIESRTGGAGAIQVPNEFGQMGFGKGVAPAGDLMSALPEEMRAMNLMCYIGHEGTYTPAHREMCASLGHNIMVETSTNEYGAKAGSSLWFMTETKEREVVSEYFLSMLGHDIEVEKHFAQINAWKKAPFNVWVVEQKLGDLILIPPLAPHQVWNRGTRTMKAAWNRTTVDTLELALHEALPRARLVCRDEQYKNKAIIYYSLVKYYDLLLRDTIEPQMWKFGRVKQTLEDFKRLFALYQEVLVSEMFAAAQPEKDVEMLPFDSNVTCSYCRCNIFNRFLTCRSCIVEEVDTYDICMECFAMGRSCACISNFSWVEQWQWSDLTANYERWRQLLVKRDGFFDFRKSAQPLDIAKKRYGRKPIAHVCQEQLKIRPWKDINNVVHEPEVTDFEPEVDDEGRVKRKKTGAARGRHPKKVAGKTHSCHVCFHQEYIWKLAFCTTCAQAYCYGVLWRAFDLMPQEVMEDRDWSCPRCLGICSCGACRKKANQQPYKPKGTLLGHETKKVADLRSVESLVDFSKTNLTWLRGEGDDNPQESARMKKLKEKAEAAKAQEDVIDENYLDTGNQGYNGYDRNDENAMLEIDPQLLEIEGTAQPSDGDYGNEDNSGHGGSSNEKQRDRMNNLDVEFDDYIPENSHNTSKLDAPVPPMVVQEPAAGVEPVPVGAGRMMGGGYYQQESNGLDKILYDAPIGEESSEPNIAPTVLPTPAGMKLSDLIPQQQEVMSKKKRKNTDQDDRDFFTSKRQKKAVTKRKETAVKKRLAGQIAGTMVLDLDDDASEPKKQLLDRGFQKPQTYINIGEEAMPYTEDDILVAPESKPRADEDDAVRLAALAMKHMNKNGDGSVDQPAKERRSRRTRGSTDDAGQSPNVPSPKKERKPLWLARKEAEDSSEVFPSEVATRRKRRSGGTRDDSEPSVVVDISSGSKDEYAEKTSRNADGESLYGSDPFASEHSAAEENSRESPAFATKLGRPSKGRRSESVSTDSDSETHYREKEAYKFRVGNPRKSLGANETPKTGIRPCSSLPNPSEAFDLGDDAPHTAPKRRGHPPKNPSASSNFSARKPSGPTEMLSLKERLKMKGKSFKIVAGKPTRVSASSSRIVLSDSYTGARSEDIENVLQVESPRVQNGDTDLVSPDDDEYDMSANFNAQASKYNGTVHDAPKYTETGSMVIRKDVSLSPSPEPTPFVQNKKNYSGPTVIRKDGLDLASPERQRSPATMSPPAIKGPTIVRLVSPEEESSQYETSEDEEIMLPKPSHTHGRVTAVDARRGGGRPSFT
ncbi:hypothetical protein BJ878DRAFT_76943 [Calycina marina]|uniref:JmjC domain-containing protein n=1 Tax=Calycina marina TaxID=1763456 RepID=A0A9P7ZB33_9HELO|nr:hypothetical protein BJ878DRAFT_76943 [Calycina marina]